MLKAKCRDTALFLWGPWNLNHTFRRSCWWSADLVLWGALCLCLRCVIDSTAVTMIYILKMSCYASMVNKQAMTLILFVLPALVCSGYTFEFSQRASFSISHFVQSCKNTISVFNHWYSRKDMKRLPSKTKSTSKSRQRKMPAGKRQSSALWGYEGCESFWSFGS